MKSKSSVSNIEELKVNVTIDVRGCLEVKNVSDIFCSPLTGNAMRFVLDEQNFKKLTFHLKLALNYP